MDPVLSIIIPTHDRPQLVERSVRSALAQQGAEVIVVDDGSTLPLEPYRFPDARTIRLPENRGVAAARNEGAKAARGRFVAFLDDDDELLPHFAAVSLAAIEQSGMPRPVAALSGVESVRLVGSVERRLPPSLPRGAHFNLEKVDPGSSFFTKQTLVVDRDVFLAMGGFDDAFRSRVDTDLLLRLNPVCSIEGARTVTYRLFEHRGRRLQSTKRLRQLSFRQLLEKHRDILAEHPEGYARFVMDHAATSLRYGQAAPAARYAALAVTISPRASLERLAHAGLSRFRYGA